MKRRTTQRALNIQQMAKLIQKRVHWFNGWHASDESEYKSCVEAAKNVMRFLERRRKRSADKRF
jgi:hypothetical protein